MNDIRPLPSRGLVRAVSPCRTIFLLPAPVCHRQLRPRASMASHLTGRSEPYTFEYAGDLDRPRRPNGRALRRARADGDRVLQRLPDVRPDEPDRPRARRFRRRRRCASAAARERLVATAGLTARRDQLPVRSASGRNRPRPAHLEPDTAPPPAPARPRRGRSPRGRPASRRNAGAGSERPLRGLLVALACVRARRARPAAARAAPRSDDAAARDAPPRDGRGCAADAPAPPGDARACVRLELAPVQARAIELLERTPLTLAQLRSELAKEWPERDANALAYAVRYLVPLVQVTPRGVWGRRMQPTVTTLARWLGAEPAPRQGGSDELVLRYLRAFGPATVGDIRTWSWLSDLGSVVDRMRPELSVYRDETGRELFDVRDGAFADRAVTAPVRFLPQFHNVFLSHADRSRIMDAVRWDASFTHRGSFLADGFLAGSWKLAESSRREATLTLDVRARVPSAERRLIREEAEALLLFLTPRAKSRRVVVERR